MTEEDYLNQAGKYFRENQLDRASQVLEEAILAYPRSSEFHYNLGLATSQEGNFDQAIEEYQKAIQISPKFEMAHLNLGVISIKKGQVDKGISCFENLLKINRHSFPAYYNLGLAWEKKGQYLQALRMFDEALKINPSHAEVFFKAGLLSYNLGKIHQSAKYFKQSVEINPNMARAQGSLGEVYEKLGKYQEAKIVFEKALKLDPSIFPEISVSLYYLAKKTNDWKKMESFSRRINNHTRRGLKGENAIVEPPFTNIERTDDIKQNLEVARYWSSMLDASIKLSNNSFENKWKKSKSEKIRLGYLSADIRDHPVTRQIADLFKYHNQEKFETYVYSYGEKDKGTIYKSIRKQANFFRDLSETDHFEIANIIYKDKIDILIDLMGYTGDQKPDITAFRPAPIQISYLGYLATTGSSYIDYILADKIVIPEQDKKYYSEKILYLPGCYQICGPQKISKKMVKRADFGLPTQGIVFGSFNRSEKIERKIFDIWIKVLKRVPKSVLWLFAYTDNDLAKLNLKKYFRASGLNTKRLIFADKLPMSENLARLKLVDIGLDTQIYSGGVTTADLLWAGTPVITVYGKHYLSRMSSSILMNFDLPELATNNLQEYEELIVDLALDPKKLANISNKIQVCKQSSSLFNSKLFTQNLEEILENIWSQNLIDVGCQTS